MHQHHGKTIIQVIITGQSYIEIIDDEMIVSSDEESADLQIAISNSLVREDEDTSISLIKINFARAYKERNEWDAFKCRCP